MLLEPPPPKYLPDCVTATIVEPKANESGSTCVLCCGPEFVYGSELIGCASTLAADIDATISSARPAATASSDLPTPLTWLSPKVARSYCFVVLPPSGG